MTKIKRLYLFPLLLVCGGTLAGGDSSDLQSRVTQLERMVESKGLLSIFNELESLQQEVRVLRGEVEQQAYTIEQMKKRQQNIYDDLYQRMQATQGGESGQEVKMLETTLPGEASVIPDEIPSSQEQMKVEIVEGGTERSSAVAPVETYVARKTGVDENPSSEIISDPQSTYPQTSPEMASGSNEEDSYSEAFTLLKQGQQDKAIGQFRGFLQQYPGSQYADNAQYWLGEAFYAKRDFKPAIAEYKILLDRYPDSGKASHALLKIGYCYDELGQKDFAQGELEDLIARYPGTSAANLAEERLSIIRSQ